MSASDINQSLKKKSSNPPATLYEESEEGLIEIKILIQNFRSSFFVIETDPEFTDRLKEDRKYLAKGTNRKLPSSKYLLTLKKNV